MPDDRTRDSVRYPLRSLLTIISMALLCGAVSIKDIHRLGQRLTQSQRAAIGLRRRNGKNQSAFYPVPCVNTYTNILARIDHRALERLLTLWISAQYGHLPRTLALDGKNLRDQLGMLVSLVDTQTGDPIAMGTHLMPRPLFFAADGRFTAGCCSLRGCGWRGFATRRAWLWSMAAMIWDATDCGCSMDGWGMMRGSSGRTVGRRRKNFDVMRSCRHLPQSSRRTAFATCIRTLGLPAYDDSDSGYHHPRVENLSTGLSGIHAGLSDYETLPVHYAGAAIYSEWEMDPAGWKEWRTGFQREVAQ